MNEFTRLKKLKRKRKKKQQRINATLKRRLYKDIFVAPCCYCRVVFLIDELTIEHKTPRCLGGTNNDDNIDLACPACNHERGHIAWLSRRDLMKLFRKRLRNLHDQHSA